MQLLAKFKKKILYMWFRATLHFRNFKVASTAGACTEFFYTLSKVASYPAYQNSMIRKHFTVLFFKYKHLKLKLRVFLAGHGVAMVTSCITKILPTCSPVTGQFFDTMIVASIDKEC